MGAFQKQKQARLKIKSQKRMIFAAGYISLHWYLYGYAFTDIYMVKPQPPTNFCFIAFLSNNLYTTWKNDENSHYW